jgi:hypothetical protein
VKLALKFTTISVGALCFAAGLGLSHAQATPGFGTSELTSVRHCATRGALALSDDQDCGGAVGTAVFQEGGGPGLSSSAAPLNDPAGYAGSISIASADLDPNNFGLPVLHGSTFTFGNDSRTNSSASGYQSFIYTGAAPIAYGLSGTLEFEGSSQSPADGELPGGVMYGAYIGIYDANFFPTLNTLADIDNSNYGAFNTCGTPGLLAFGLTTSTTPGGAFSASVSTSACGGGQLTLTPGDQYVAVASVEVFANRGGFADFSNTFTTTLDPSLGPTTLAALSQTIDWGVDAIPEPTAWALMIGGFGLAGVALRRRRTTAAT